MIKVLYIITLLSSVLGALVAFVGVTASKGAPQEAAAAAMGLALALIPYVFSRCVQLSSERDAADKRIDRLVRAIEELKGPDTRPAPLYQGRD